MKVLLEGTLHLRYTRTESCSEEKARFNHSMLCGSVIIIIHCILLCNAHVSTKTKTTPTNAKIAHHDAPFVPNVIPGKEYQDCQPLASPLVTAATQQSQPAQQDYRTRKRESVSAFASHAPVLSLSPIEYLISQVFLSRGPMLLSEKDKAGP